MVYVSWSAICTSQWMVGLFFRETSVFAFRSPVPLHHLLWYDDHVDWSGRRLALPRPMILSKPALAGGSSSIIPIS